ncbi:putative xyloglucan 6-xylosyltransferase 5 [Zea mays]|uniref:Putative xyloglucan 6-xylosyltransferase 5 n=1 Tax=Zea mays TaxID=4577 RepID=A0A1D6N847_MAIZE|nr:putative xyloglucan 6-xylosyltransferase 5 [Zea mays]
MSHSDDDPDAGPDDNDEAPTSTSSSAATGDHYDCGAAWTTANYRLQPRVTRWKAKRRRWLHQNPGFPSRDARGGPRVLLVTASPQGPCGSPDGDRFLLRATKNRLDYCRLHGVDMVHATARLEDPELRSAGYGDGWAKLALLRRLMLAHPEVEWLWWLDVGALVTDMGFELPLARYEGAHLVVRGDSYQLFQRRAWDAASTASFLLRNCQWSLDLLDAWVVMAPKGRARHDAGELLTATLAGRPTTSPRLYTCSSPRRSGGWTGCTSRTSTTCTASGRRWSAREGHGEAPPGVRR